MAKKQNNHQPAKPAFEVPDRDHSIVAGSPAAQASSPAAETGGGRPPLIAAATAEKGRVETVHFLLRRVAIELPCAVAGDDVLGPRHLHASLSMNARRALKALVRGLDLAAEADRNKRRPRNTTPASVNFMLERLWEEIHDGQ